MTITRKNIKADLHIHSNFSDGKYSPLEILQKAKEAGFSAISITDHDNIILLTTITLMPSILQKSHLRNLELK